MKRPLQITIALILLRILLGLVALATLVGAYNVGLAMRDAHRASVLHRQFLSKDHQAILQAGRQMIRDRDKYNAEWPRLNWIYSTTDEVVWSVESGPLSTNVPQAIRDLEPISIQLNSRCAQIRLPVSGARSYVFVFAEGIEGGGTEQVIPGLWYAN